jgi:hypothetical protein
MIRALLAAVRLQDQAPFLPSDLSQCTKASAPPRCAMDSLSRKRNLSDNCFALVAEFAAFGAVFTFSNGLLPPLTIFVTMS